jgi:hypothetical protein
MRVYVPPFAPFVVLVFLGTVSVLCLCVVAAGFAALRKSRGLVLLSLGTGLCVIAIYAAILLGASAFSREVVLAPGEWKYFCELDCHLAYSVASAKAINPPGPELQAGESKSQFILVQIKTWFDPDTISPHRGNGPLTPNGRGVLLVDRSGRSYGPSPTTERILSELRLGSTPLTTPLRPGETYTSWLVFEAPAGTSGFCLLLTSADKVVALVWNHESSLFHKKSYFALPPT